jgi:hypothetical protein
LGTAAIQTRHNRTITVDFHNETTYFQLLGDGKAFVELVMAFILSIGFQLKHKATCRGGGCMNAPLALSPCPFVWGASLASPVYSVSRGLHGLAPLRVALSLDAP